MTAPRPKTCRFVTSSGWPCRRSITHRLHVPHNDVCEVPKERHHAFVAATVGRERRPGDPFVRTSILLRQSNIAYLSKRYGRGKQSLRIRQLIEKDCEEAP